jgi:hypothetical protein
METDKSRRMPRMQFISFVIYENIHNFTVTRSKTDKPRKVFISRNLNLNILLFVDDVILFTNSEDVLQCSTYQFQPIAEKCSTKISIDKIIVMAFKGKEHIRSKILFTINPQSKYLHLNISVITSPMKRISTSQLKY